MSRLTRAIQHWKQRQNAVPRKIAGYHNDRLDGISDILLRAKGASVLDVGCYRGMVSLEFAYNGASLIHGCDRFAAGIETARQIFADIPVQSQFEIVELTGGYKAIEAAFGSSRLSDYDIVLFLGVHQNLKDKMKTEALNELTFDLAKRAKRYFVHRSTEPDLLDPILKRAGLHMVQQSTLSNIVGPSAIWASKSAHGAA